MNNQAKSILLVEDDDQLRSTLEFALNEQGYHAVVACSPRAAMELARDHRPDLIVSDVHFDDGDGRDLLTEFRQEDSLASCPFVLMTGDRLRATQRSSMNLGADDYLEKPFTAEDFLECVQARLNRSDLLQDSQRRLLDELRGTISQSLPHEFLTPLNGILGFAEYLRKEPSGIEEAREMADTIYLCGVRLLRTIRNYLAILDLMENPLERAALPDKPVSAGQIKQALEELASGLAVDRERVEDLEVSIEVDNAAAFRIELDCLRVVARELADNALKFSPPGSRVRIRVREVSGELVLIVTDNGRGLSEDRIRAIGAFRQFDRSRYAQQGLGLGLTLTQQMLTKYGGRLCIQSVPELGTTARACWPTGADA